MRAQLYGATLAVVWMATTVGARADGNAINFNFNFQMSIDCEQPKQINDVPVNGAGSGVLNLNKTGSVDLTLTALTSNTLHFEGKLGGRPTPAPGGTTSIRIIGGNRLQAIWELPNNQIVTTVKISSHSCKASVNFKLKHGNNQYTLFDGQNFYFCSRPRLISTSCSLR
jgi:hypothetical protein